MNAVNLIPADLRPRRFTVPTNPATLGLLGALVLALVGAVMYISTVNTVHTRQRELARVTHAADAWNAAAAKYGDSVQAAQKRAQELADVRQLVAGRYPWQRLLAQVGKLMPSQAGLASMAATTTPGASPSAPPIPAIQLTGCAASQSMVAQTMVQLHRITGVTAVTLASATDSGSAGGNGGGGCGFPVQFDVSLTFAPSPAIASSPAATGGTSTTPAATPSGGATSPSAAVPSKPTPSGGSATASAAAPLTTTSPAAR